MVGMVHPVISLSSLQPYCWLLLPKSNRLSATETCLFSGLLSLPTPLVMLVVQGSQGSWFVDFLPDVISVDLFLLFFFAFWFIVINCYRFPLFFFFFFCLRDHWYFTLVFYTDLC